MDYILRTANQTDAPRLYEISQLAHSAAYYETLIPADYKEKFDRKYTWSEEKRDKFITLMSDRIDDPSWNVLVAESNGRVLGYTLATNERPGYLMKKGLFLDPNERGKGIGKALFEESLAWAQPGDIIELSVIAENTIARSLYEKFGFKVIGDDPKTFYGARQVIMQKNTSEGVQI